MLPFEDHPERERRGFPIVMISLVVLNVLVFLYMLSLTPSQLERFVFTFGMVPANITGAAQPTFTSAIPPVLTLVTALFVHGGILHIVGNMIFLWVFGDNVESALGHITFLIFYLVVGVLAMLAFIAAFPTSNEPVIGASGAISGVLAGYLLLFPRAQVQVLLFIGPFFTLGRVAAIFMIFAWFLLQLIESLVTFLPGAQQTDGVAYLAHVGGFIAGLIIVGAIRTVRHEPLGRFQGRFGWNWAFRNWVITALLLAALLGIGALVGGSTGSFIASGTLGVAAFVALVDGILRVSGHRGLLGEGQGLGRLLAVLQTMIAILALLALLP